MTYILDIEKDSEDGVIVTFSDGTTAGYVVEELLMLRPRRERVSAYLTSAEPVALVANGRSVGARC
jgi:hypothetical protein